MLYLRNIGLAPAGLGACLDDSTYYSSFFSSAHNVVKLCQAHVSNEEATSGCRAIYGAVGNFC